MVPTWKKCRWYCLSRYSIYRCIVNLLTSLGLMTTSYVIYWVLHKLLIPVDIRNVCVFLAPVFAAFTALAAYFLTKEITRKSQAGLFAALFVAIVPSYMSRSVAGSYDNEGVAIFALVNTFFVFLKSLNTVNPSPIYLLTPVLGLFVVVYVGFPRLFIHGCLLGWLCLHYQHYSHLDGKI